MSATAIEKKEKEQEKEIKTYSIKYNLGIFCISWSPNDIYLAIGCSDGIIRILNGINGKLLYKLSTTGSMPITSIKWKSSSYLITTSSSGYIDIWHIQSSKCIYSINEENNEIYAFDINCNNKYFASAGKDKIIRIYDDETKKLNYSLKRGFITKELNPNGHSNRIFCLKFKKDDPNILLSGGWDNCILFWDLRSNKTCFRSIFGPHIAGNTIDIQNDIIIAGSWRIKNSIQLFNFSSCKEISNHNLNWNPSPMIYSLSFNPFYEGLFAAGGSGINKLKIFDINNNDNNNNNYQQLNNKKAIYCLDWNTKGNLVAFAGHSCDIKIVSI